MSNINPELAELLFQVHKETIDKVPNSQPSRGNIEIEIYGMEGIPDADLKAHESARGQDDDDEPGAKHAKSDSPAVPTPPLQQVLVYYEDYGTIFFPSQEVECNILPSGWSSDAQSVGHDAWCNGRPDAWGHARPSIAWWPSGGSSIAAPLHGHCTAGVSAACQS